MYNVALAKLSVVSQKDRKNCWDSDHTGHIDFKRRNPAAECPLVEKYLEVQCVL